MARNFKDMHGSSMNSEMGCVVIIVGGGHSSGKPCTYYGTIAGIERGKNKDKVAVNVHYKVTRGHYDKTWVHRHDATMTIPPAKCIMLSGGQTFLFDKFEKAILAGDQQIGGIGE